MLPPTLEWIPFLALKLQRQMASSYEAAVLQSRASLSLDKLSLGLHYPREAGGQGGVYNAAIVTSPQVSRPAEPDYLRDAGT